MIGPAGVPSPLLPGFNPDPSIVLVDGVYYLITSTFEYLPGIPLYRSTDFVEWEHIGNVLTRPDQAGIGAVPTPGGVWAPTIRFKDGVFYVIVTVMLAPRGCVVFTAADPAGPWSNGVQIPAVHGIDPDLVWDDDGVAHVTYAFLDQGIFQVAIDLTDGRALSEPRLLTSGSGLYAPEGPHLYQRDNFWYLLVAEGGTDRGHVVSVARGPGPTGPFQWYEHNPVVSARSTGHPIQNLGHADLTEMPDGTDALVLLGVRPVGLTKAFSPLGRETFVTSLRWADGWPLVRELPADPADTVASEDVDFTDPAALDDPGWLAVRAVPCDIALVSSAQGRLTIAVDGVVPLESIRPRFVGRRQRHLRALVSVAIDVSAGTGGLAARLSEDHWVAIEARTVGEEEFTLTGRARLSGFEHTWSAVVPVGPLRLILEFAPPPSDFSAGAVGGDRISLAAMVGDQRVELAELDGRYWTFETAKSFTGRVLGMYATTGDVTFADFRYRGGSAANS